MQYLPSLPPSAITELRNGNLAPLPLRPEVSGKLSLRMTVKEHKRTLPKGASEHGMVWYVEQH